MKKVPIYVIVLLLLITVCASNLSAQIPNVAIYFDSAMLNMASFCPTDPWPATVVDTLYIVAQNFNMQMSAIEYKIGYPSELAHLLDVADQHHTSVGSSDVGIVINFVPPINAFESVVVQRVLAMWYCSQCGGSPPIPIVVQPHPTSGKVSAVRSSDGAIIDAIGMTSMICPHVPVESTTWGQVKSLYR